MRFWLRQQQRLPCSWRYSWWQPLRPQTQQQTRLWFWRPSLLRWQQLPMLCVAAILTPHVVAGGGGQCGVRAEGFQDLTKGGNLLAQSQAALTFLQSLDYCSPR
mmetsp:Transcript_7059/g.10620  ORF Transcript_7059/g.10620 Transcript_7059/m.10620 type:complete len:104 (-) Transcript_7059:5-316(-)